MVVSTHGAMAGESTHPVVFLLSTQPPTQATPTEGLDRPPTHPPQLSRPPGTRSVLGPVMAEEPRGRDDRMSPEVLGGVLGWPEGVGDSRRA